MALSPAARGGTGRRRFQPVAPFVLAAVLPLVAGGCEKADDSSGLSASGSNASGGTRGAVITLGGSSGSASGSPSRGGTGGTSAEPGSEAGEAGQPAWACETLAGLDQCGGMRVEAMPVPVNVLLVIDKSGSMTDRPEGFALDKWTAMKEALGSALSSAPSTVRFGLLLFPRAVAQTIPLQCDGELCCEVPGANEAVSVGVGSDRIDAVGQALSETSPGGGTPTAAALAQALDYYVQGEGLALEGERYVLLATDGGPNCNPELSCDSDLCTPNLDGAAQCAGANCCQGAGEFCLDDAGVTQQIEALKAAGIATFVVGIPGSESYTTYLDAFARAGGVPQQGTDHDYFAVSAQSGVSGLTGVLKGITTQLLRSCEVALTTPPGLPSLVNVAIDCEVLSKEGATSGWDFDDTNAPTRVILRGAACDDIKASGAHRIDVVYGCTTIR